MVSIAQIHKLTSIVYYVVFNLMDCKISVTELMYKRTKLLKIVVCNKSWRLGVGAKIKCLNGQSIFSYKSIVLLTRIIFTFTCINHHIHDICLSYPRKVNYLYDVVWICYVFFSLITHNSIDCV